MHEGGRVGGVIHSARTVGVGGSAVDEGSALVRPTPLQSHLATELAGQPLVGRQAVADCAF